MYETSKDTVLTNINILKLLVSWKR